MKVPGPDPRPDGGVGAIAEAGGLRAYQLWLHAEYGPVARFQLPGAEAAVSVADPVLLEATAHPDGRPECLFAFLDPRSPRNWTACSATARHPGMRTSGGSRTWRWS
ncbi:hypothetical protein [Kitasatospora sp. NPDC087314]|uniref:hypothetical protein n=1 Tax=Kitasatospora sp. NPDC087314 TaxID=3364068 RepID=UPI00380DC86C